MGRFERLRGFDVSLMYHPEDNSLLLRYGLPISAVAASIFVTLVLAPLEVRSPYLFFLPAVVFAVWYGGLWPGLMASLQSTMAANVFLPGR